MPEPVYRLRGLDEAAKEYVRSMLAKAGADPDLLDDAALICAHGASGGSIRRLNAVVVNALTIGAQNQARCIDADMVRSAAAELSPT